MNKEELIKELSLTDEELKDFTQEGGIQHSYLKKDVAKAAVRKVLSNPKILIKKDDQKLFHAWDKETSLEFDLDAQEKYALVLGNKTNLIYCDMEGVAIGDDGYPYLLDECGNYECLDPSRFEIRLAAIPFNEIEE